MDKMSLREVRVKIRTPIGLLLVLAVSGKLLLDTFEEGRVILDNLPPILQFMARPLPMLIVLLAGLGLIFWELHDIRKSSGEPTKRHLRHYLLNSLFSFVGLLVIMGIVYGCYGLYARHWRESAPNPPLAASTAIVKPATPISPPQPRQSELPSSGPTKAAKHNPDNQPKPVEQANTTPPPVQQKAGNNAVQVGGGITAEPCSSVQIGGKGNQATVNCTIPTIQGVQLRILYECEIDKERRASVPGEVITERGMFGPVGARLEGSSPISLAFTGTIHTIRSQSGDSAVVVEDFILPPNSIQGQSATLLDSVTGISAVMMWPTHDGGNWCAKQKQVEVGLKVNGSAVVGGVTADSASIDRSYAKVTASFSLAGKIKPQ